MNYQVKIKPMKETYMHITKWKKTAWKVYILYDFNYLTFWKDKILKIVKRSVVARGY